MTDPALVEEASPDDVDSGGCDDASASGASDEAIDWSALEADELAAIDDATSGGDDDGVVVALATLYTPAQFFRPGGGWGGSEAPGLRARRIGVNGGLTVMATKEQRPKNPGSDHDVDNRRAFAVDLSNGSSPTPAMDRVARQIAAAAGIASYRFGFREVAHRPHQIRLQLIYRWTGHYNHVHAGFRRT